MQEMCVDRMLQGLQHLMLISPIANTMTFLRRIFNVFLIEDWMTKQRLQLLVCIYCWKHEQALKAQWPYDEIVFITWQRTIF